MTNKITTCCVSKEQKDVLRKLIGYKSESNLYKLLDDLQTSYLSTYDQTVNIRRDKGWAGAYMTLEFEANTDRITLRKYIDYQSGEYVDEKYYIKSNGEYEKV